MDLEAQLAAAFQKFIDHGIESLSVEEQRLCRAQQFIALWLNGGLSGYFYNTLPDHDEVNRVIDSLQQLGLTAHHECLTEAYELFRNYQDDGPPSTWGEIRKEYDPNGRLDQLNEDLGKKILNDL